MDPKETIPRFDAFLSRRGLSFEAVVIGGTALALLGVISRRTRDCDVLYPAIPEAIGEAAAAFSRQAGRALDPEWFNEGPRQVAETLPPGWEQRLQVVFEGRALTLRTLGRIDLLRTKVFALCDRAVDLGDCIALAPSSEELAEITQWLLPQDANPGWPGHVREVVADLGRRLGHGV